MKISNTGTWWLRLLGLIAFVLPLCLTLTRSMSQGCCGKSGSGSSITGYLEGILDDDTEVQILDNTETVIASYTVNPDDNGGAFSGEISIPLPPGDESVGIKFVDPGGSAGTDFGIRVGGDVLIWKTTDGDHDEGDTYGRPSDWIGKGSQWWIKNRFPFGSVDGKLGRFESALPELVLPDYTTYSSPTEEPHLYWLLRFGEGGNLELSGELNTGSTLHDHDSIQFHPANSSSKSWIGYGTDGSDQFVFAEDGASSPEFVVEVSDASDPYTITVYDGTYFSGLGPFTNPGSTSYVMQSFTVDEITSTSTYNYALRISTGSNQSDLHGSADTTGFDAKVIHDTGVSTNTRTTEVTSSIASGIRDLQTIEKENTTVVSDVIEEFKLIAGLERMISREESVSTGSTVRETIYTWEEVSSDADFGKLLKVEHKYGGTLTNWTAYSYAYGASSYTVHTYTPWEDAPTTPPGSPNPSSFSGKLVSRVYDEATSSRPRRLTSVVTKRNNTKMGDVQYTYSTMSDGVSGVTFDVQTEKLYTSASAYLQSKTVTWPRNPSSTYRLWATNVRYSEAPDLTKMRYTYGGGSSNLTTTVWNEPLVDGKSKRTESTTDMMGKTISEETDLYIGSSWQSNVTKTDYAYDNASRPTTVKIASKTVGYYSYPSDEQVVFAGLEGIEERRKYDRLGRLKENKRDSGGGVATNTTSITFSGLTTTTTRTGGSLTLTTKRTVDRLGRPTITEDADGQTTVYAYAVASGGGMKTTVTSPSGLTRVTENYRDGRVKSITGTGVWSQYYDYNEFLGTRSTNIHYGTSSNVRKQSTYYDWAGRVTETSRPAVSGNISQKHYYYANGTTGKGGKLNYIDTTGNSLIGNLVYDYDSNGNLLYSGHTGVSDTSPTPAGTEEVTRQETKYVKESNGWFWKKTEIGVYDTNSSSNLREISTSATRIDGDPYVQQSYFINYTDKSGSYGVATETKRTILSRSSETSKVETTNWDLAGFSQATGTGTTKISYTATTNFTNGYMQSASTATVSALATYDYDDLGRQTHIKNPRTNTNTITSYWNTETTSGSYKGKIKSVKDALNNETTYYYYTTESGHPSGAIKHVQNAASKYTRYQYNGKGQTTHVWGDTSYPVKYEYDPTYGDRTEMHTYKSGSWTSPTLPGGFTSSGDTTTWVYHAASGLLTSKKDAANKSVSYTYKSGSALLEKRTWARGVYTTYSYSDKGRVTLENHSDTTPDVTYDYDRMGRVKEIEDDAGKHTFTESFSSGAGTFTEDITSSSGGNRTSVLSGIDIVTKADKWGRRTNFDADKGASKLADFAFSYQSLTSRLEKVTATFPTIGDHSGTYTYATNSDLIATVLHKKGTSTQLTQTRTWHSSLDRLTKIDNSTTTTFSSHEYVYDSLHRRTKATTEDAAYWDYVYDDRGQVTDATKKLSGGTAIYGWNFDYTYDQIGNRTYFSGDSGDEWHGLNSYDSLNQPTTITGGAYYMVKGRTESTGSPTIKVDSVSQTVSTQTAGSKKYFKASVTSATTPDSQSVVITDGTQSSSYSKFVPASTVYPTFDDDGNLTEDARFEYTWDANNRLKKIETRSAAVTAGSVDWTLDFKYDHQGRRIEKKVTWGGYGTYYTDTYVYDGWNLVATLRSGSLRQTHVWGLDLSGSNQGAGGVGGLLMTYTVSGTKVHFPAYDGNGNIMSLLKASTASVEADYAYDAFGRLQRIRGTSNVEWDNPFRFSTKFTDDETGHIYYGLRYLDIVHGRWLSRDPIGERGGFNLYAFIRNSGVNLWDYLGMVEDWGDGSAPIVDPQGADNERIRNAEKAVRGGRQFPTMKQLLDGTRITYDSEQTDESRCCNISMCEAIGEFLNNLAFDSRIKDYADFIEVLGPKLPGRKMSIEAHVYFKTMLTDATRSGMRNAKSPELRGKRCHHKGGFGNAGRRDWREPCISCSGFKDRYINNGSEHLEHFAGILLFGIPGHAYRDMQDEKDFRGNRGQVTALESRAEIEGNHAASDIGKRLVRELDAAAPWYKSPIVSNEAWNVVRGNVKKYWISTYCRD